MEKPVCTDARGYNRIIEAAKLADEKGLKVVVGLQRHYQDVYREAFQKVHEEGLIGDIISAQCWWNGGRPWTISRQPDWTELEYQMRNWYHFAWVCGDHIAEQHVHNIDIVNWFVSGDSVKGGHPVSAQGMGSRSGWESPKSGEIFDHHYVEFRFENDVIMNSQCRQIRGAWRRVAEEIHGSEGILYLNQGEIKDHKGKSLWKFRRRRDAPKSDPYQVEHDDLQRAIRNNLEFNEAFYGATSTMTGILGRMAAYSGKLMRYSTALEKGVELAPGIDDYTFESTAPVQPDADGFYPVPQPGSYNPIA